MVAAGGNVLHHVERRGIVRKGEIVQEELFKGNMSREKCPDPEQTEDENHGECVVRSRCPQ